MPASGAPENGANASLIAMTGSGPLIYRTGESAWTEAFRVCSIGCEGSTAPIYSGAGRRFRTGASDIGTLARPRRRPARGRRRAAANRRDSGTPGR
ncbi:unnamed protein product, partial [Iphiclides podalirius]